MATIKFKPKFNKDYFEKQAWSTNQYICGIDEVGRGCLAGPVVVAAAILPMNTSYRGLKDSKLMTKEDRLRAFSWIQKKCYFSWAIFHHRGIDQYNIYWATLRTMRRAFIQLCSTSPILPSKIVVDAMPLSLRNTAYEHIDVAYFNYGEKKSRSIAAASIVAKVIRDELMQKVHSHIPGYSLHTHKGYSTPHHKKLVREHGPSILHRKSFLKKVITFHIPSDYEDQHSFC